MIEVNGKKLEYQQELTVSELLDQLRYVFPMLVVKINGNLVKKEKFEQTRIQDGDQVNIIHLISGG